MVIEIQVIPHNLQRYPTVGDWYLDQASGKMLIKVSDMEDWRAESLVSIHELVEALLCRAAGVESHQVDAWDMAYEKNRKPGDDSEPGDHPDAPYHKQHFIATQVEKLVCAAMGLTWSEYEQMVKKL